MLDILLVISQIPATHPKTSQRTSFPFHHSKAFLPIQFPICKPQMKLLLQCTIQINSAYLISYFYYNNKFMKSDFQYNRNLFSHSIKQMAPQIIPNFNDQTPKKSSPVRTRQWQQRKNIRRKNRVELLRLQEQHQSYEKMIDQIMKKHVQQENLPLLKTKLFIKHSYKNYRITNSDTSELDQNPTRLLEKISEIKSHNVSPVKRSSRRKSYKGERSLKTQIIRSLMSEKDYKAKRSPLQLPSILKYDRGSLLQSPKMANNSTLSHKSNRSMALEEGFEEMKKKFIKKYVRSYTEN